MNYTPISASSISQKTALYRRSKKSPPKILVLSLLFFLTLSTVISLIFINQRRTTQKQAVEGCITIVGKGSCQEFQNDFIGSACTGEKREKGASDMFQCGGTNLFCKKKSDTCPECFDEGDDSIGFYRVTGCRNLPASRDNPNAAEWTLCRGCSESPTPFVPSQPPLPTNTPPPPPTGGPSVTPPPGVTPTSCPLPGTVTNLKVFCPLCQQ